jgi:hypothetical protein
MSAKIQEKYQNFKFIFNPIISCTTTHTPAQKVQLPTHTSIFLSLIDATQRPENLIEVNNKLRILNFGRMVTEMKIQVGI